MVFRAAQENDTYDKIRNIKVYTFSHVIIGCIELGCWVFVLFQPLLVCKNLLTTDPLMGHEKNNIQVSIFMLVAAL